MFVFESSGADSEIGAVTFCLRFPEIQGAGFIYVDEVICHSGNSMACGAAHRTGITTTVTAFQYRWLAAGWLMILFVERIGKDRQIGNVAHLLGAKYPSTRPVTRTTKPEPRCRTRPRYTNQSASTARDARTEPPPNGSCPNRAARTTEPGRVPAKSRFPAWWQSRGKQTK